ncbi:MAG: Na+/H+ antiporter subunit E [Pseudomonadota bacterium]
MREIGLNALIAIAFAWAFEWMSPLGLGIGAAVGFVVVGFGQAALGETWYLRRARAWVRLIVMFHYELIVSSVDVAVDVLTPRHRANPAIIDVPLDVKSDLGILLVSNLISLTPGTLSLDISEDRRTLRVHAMFADDPDALCKSLKSGMESWVIDAVEGA